MLANKKSNSDRGGSGGSITGGGGSAIVGGSGAGGAGDSEDGGSSQSSHGTDVEVAEALDGDSLEGGPSARQPQFRYVIQVSRTDWTFQIFAILQGIKIVMDRNFTYIKYYEKLFASKFTLKCNGRKKSNLKDLFINCIKMSL